MATEDSTQATWTLLRTFNSGVRVRAPSVVKKKLALAMRVSPWWRITDNRASFTVYITLITQTTDEPISNYLTADYFDRFWLETFPSQPACAKQILQVWRDMVQIILTWTVTWQRQKLLATISQYWEKLSRSVRHATLCYFRSALEDIHSPSTHPDSTQ